MPDRRMIMTTGSKLALAAVIAIGTTAYVAYSAASSGWQYYLSVDECMASDAPRHGDRIRVNGTIAKETLQIAADRREASFALAGTERNLRVVCPGPLPDNLRAGLQVVVEGRLDESGLLQGERVLTRCASKYASRPGASEAQEDPPPRASRGGV
jgi:cytochrome c-type biogenesis protein CcmE